MGGLVDYTTFARKMAERDSSDRVAYGRLIQAQSKLFGQKEPSFLEQIVCDAPQPSDNHIHAVTDAAHSPLAIDFFDTRFGQFDRYDGAQYESFLYQAAAYYINNEENNIRAADRVFSVARHLFRHQEGLPPLSEPGEINAYRKTLFGRLAYAYKEIKAERRLLRFKKSILFRTPA
jgi:hypothetical protein